MIGVFGCFPFQGANDSLGISIAGGVGSPLGDVPIFIAMMNPTGLAAQTQKLKVGFYGNSYRSLFKRTWKVFVNVLWFKDTLDKHVKGQHS